MRRERILIVDTEENTRRFISEELRAMGYQTAEAETAEEAMGFIKLLLPDLVITDIKLKGTSGIELCRQIKTQDDSGHIPVIFHSEAEDDYHILSAMEQGADNYISNTGNPRLLGKLVNELILNRFSIL